MIDGSSILDAQLQRLLALIEKYQADQCSHIQAKAEQEIVRIKQAAYREARLRLHQNIMSSRQEMHDKIAAARAKKLSEQNTHYHQAVLMLLDEMLAQLERRLLDRWQVLEHRRKWINMVLAHASNVLQGQDWSVELPSDMAEDELSYIQSAVKSEIKRTPQLQQNSGILAGLRITASHAVVDGTIQGLLSDRERLRAELLARCHGNS